MDHSICGSCYSKEEGHCIEEILLFNDLGRSYSFSCQVDSSSSGLGGITEFFGIYSWYCGGTRKGHSHAFHQYLHGVGGSHEGTGTGTRTHMVFQVSEFLRHILFAILGTEDKLIKLGHDGLSAFELAC